MENDLNFTDTSVERLPPQSIEAEQAILGAILVNPETIGRVCDVLQPENFYRKAHQIIYAAVLDLFEKSEPIDIVTVSQYLKDQGKLDGVGGRQYLTDLGLSIATTANAEYYAKTVSEKSTLRNLIKAGTEIVASCYEDAEADVVVDKAEQLIFNIAQGRSMSALVPVKDIVNESFARIEKRYEQRDALSGLSTGFYDLDEMTSGWQRSDLVIIAARPSMGKCLAFDSEIVLNDGSIVTIEDLYRSGKGTLLTLSDDLKLGWTSPSLLIDDGIKPVYRVTTKLGRAVETTLCHPFLTIDGWQPLSALTVGTRIAVPRTLPVNGLARARECELKILAYLLGDGTVTGSNSRLTNSDGRVRDEFKQAVEQFGGTSAVETSYSGRTQGVRTKKDRALVHNQREAFRTQLRELLASGITQRSIATAAGVSPAAVCNWVCATSSLNTNNLRQLVDSNLPVAVDTNLCADSRSALEIWLERIGIKDKTAAEKVIPDFVFRLENEQIGLFLNRLFACDGWATVYASGQPQIGYASVSEKLCRQLQHLLLRLGIIAKLRRRLVAYKNNRRPAWQLEITDQQSLRTFISKVGIFGKEQALSRVAQCLIGRNQQTNVDLIPMQVWSKIAEAKGTQSWSALARAVGFTEPSNLHVNTRALSRGRLGKFAAALNDQALVNLSESQVYWDEIVSIEYVGDKQVYDLTIPETHNFIANDICVHNTALVLNLAQHASVECKAPVAVFSLEMSKEQLVQRLLCAEAKIDANKMRTGFLQSSDWQNLAAAMGRLGEAPLFIDDSAAVTVLDVRAKARRLKAEMKSLGLIIIDYIQLMSGRARSDGNRVQEVSEISRGLKQLARELDCPVLALSQLSRAVEARQNKRPMLSDLRESGSIEQDADIVMFIYRDDYYNQESEKRGEAEIIIAKQRNGPVGTVELLYQASITRFLNKASNNTYAQV